MELNALITFIAGYTTYSILVLGGLLFLTFIFIILLAVRISTQNRKIARLESALMAIKSVENLDPGSFGPALERIEKKFSSVLQHVAMIRFDAFENRGNGLSFALAVLDDNGDGFVISSIFGGEETRTYAKQLTGGKPSHPLSPEEEEAVKKAMDG